MYRIGIDVGGTFTDFTLIDERDGAVQLPQGAVDAARSVGGDRSAASPT